MQSNGGTAPIESVRTHPVRTILSGPAGGVIGAKHLSSAFGLKKVITLDMGGTSTDVSLLSGDIPFTTEFSISGCPIHIPLIDIHTVGAGGGSIARKDEGGALRVGPESAGAEPGPASYGKGGHLTVTDAHLLLGRLPPAGLLSGGMPLDVERAKRVASTLSRRFSLSVHALAEGVIRVANSSMERALKVISLERGHDPRDFSLFSFGGAGGLHAAELAASLGISQVIVPRNPGVLSALGMALADTVKDYSCTLLRRDPGLSFPLLERSFEPLCTRGRKEMEEDGFPKSRVIEERMMDLRYCGQSYELTVPFTPRFREAFHRVHSERFGHADPSSPLEAVNLRLRISGRIDRPPFPKIKSGSFRPGRAAKAKRRIFFHGRFHWATYYDRSLLQAGNRIMGPAVVMEYSGTTFVPPGFSAKIDPFGNILIAGDGR